jgi:hypothetical protein
MLLRLTITIGVTWSQQLLLNLEAKGAAFKLNLLVFFNNLKITSAI